jgi:hypothetical protein
MFLAPFSLFGLGKPVSYKCKRRAKELSPIHAVDSECKELRFAARSVKMTDFLGKLTWPDDLAI